MKVNSISNSSYNNKQTFKGIKINLNSLEETDVPMLLEKNIIKRFEKNKNFDLHLKWDDRNEFSYKITTIGRGLRGFFQNLRAPWIQKTFSERVNMVDANSYIRFLLPTKRQAMIDKQAEKAFQADVKGPNFTRLKRKLEDNIISVVFKKTEEY